MSGLGLAGNIKGKAGKGFGYAGTALGIGFSLSRLQAAEEAVARNPRDPAAREQLREAQKNTERAVVGGIPLFGDVVSLAEAAEKGDVPGMVCAGIGIAGTVATHGAKGLVVGNIACGVKDLVETATGEDFFVARGGSKMSVATRKPEQFFASIVGN